jgi:hypothetical protein
MVASIDVKGDVETRDSLEFVAENIHGPIMVNQMRRATILLERDAKKFSPVDTGRLRSSITHAVRTVGFLPPVLQGAVGSNVKYAPFMELGTGTFAGKARVKMPPVQALEGWARRHKISAFLVARAIFRAGGLKAHKMFEKSLEKNEDKVVDLLDEGIKITIARS